ncbi:MAG: hypothetical protein EBR92_02285 [Alphaproteobacteria bacterium]|nr:hypothetical protein [Alphaproteobacteria bacterium]
MPSSRDDATLCDDASSSDDKRQTSHCGIFMLDQMMAAFATLVIHDRLAHACQQSGFAAQSARR